MENTITIGMVVEGLNDLRVLKPVINSVINRILPFIKIEYRDLQPELDATSQTYTGGGWTEVYKWCLRFPPSIRDTMFFDGLFDGSRLCDIIVVHLDADALVEISTQSNVKLPSIPWTGVKRALFIESVLEEWLWAENGSHDRNKSRYIPLGIVWATETWLTAALDNTIADPEEQDPVPVLLALDPSLRDKSSPQKLGKSGMRKKYENMASILINDLPRVSKLCNQLNKFCDSLEHCAHR